MNKMDSETAANLKRRKQNTLLLFTHKSSYGETTSLKLCQVVV